MCCISYFYSSFFYKRWKTFSNTSNQWAVNIRKAFKRYELLKHPHLPLLCKKREKKQSLSMFEELSRSSSSPIGGFVQTKLKILSLQWQRKWLKPSPWHLQPNVLSAVYASGVQPVICQDFFIFFIKSQLLPAFYIVAVSVSEKRCELEETSAAVQIWRSSTF